jgi:thiol-disulfide isomerase/thioredoxin
VTLFVYAVLGLAATWGLYMVYMHIATRAAEGRPADPLYTLFPDIRTSDSKSLVYCYSPHCGPCRPMSKEVDILRSEGAPIFKMDIAEHPSISRELGIRATPTLVVVEKGQIGRMVLGFKNVEAMRKLLTSH